jgi:hypothetical protein
MAIRQQTVAMQATTEATRVGRLTARAQATSADTATAAPREDILHAEALDSAAVAAAMPQAAVATAAVAVTAVAATDDKPAV